MTDPALSLGDETDGAERTPEWGILEAIGAWMFGFVCVTLIGGLVFASGDWETTSDMPLALRMLLTVPLWIGLLGVPAWAAKTKGFGMVSDFRLRQIGTDIPLGIIVGVVSQFGLIWVLYQALSPWIDPDTVDDAARELTDQATGFPTILVLVLVVGVGAPIVEEIFFRGMLYRAIGDRWGVIAAVLGSSVIFGLTHFQAIQLPGLIAFGLVLAALVHFTGRLGAAIWAHLAFNISTLILLLAF